MNSATSGTSEATGVREMSGSGRVVDSVTCGSKNPHSEINLLKVVTVAAKLLGKSIVLNICFVLTLHSVNVSQLVGTDQTKAHLPFKIVTVTL